MYKSVLISLFCAGCAFAQIETQTAKSWLFKWEVRSNSGLVISSTQPLGDSVPPIAGAPYSAQSTTQRIQTLSDGNHIQQTTSSTVYRDSQGRVRTERVLSELTPPGADARHLITVDDPVAGYNFTLDPNTKTAFRFVSGKNPLLAAARTKFETAISAGPGGDIQVMRKAAAPIGGQVAIAEPNSTEAQTQLGAQTIEGVLAQGTRITRTIPAGTIGNDQPIVITTETWFSPDLKVLVMSKSDDPRIGETTYKLTNIQRAEPSPALFQIPSDYTIKEGPGPVKTFFAGKPEDEDQLH